MPDLVMPELNRIGSTILNYGVFLAAVGTIVMALQEVFKGVFHTRLWFNKKEFYKWLGKNEGLRWEFLALTTGGYESEKALFDQPVEKMMGQIQSAANMALDFPGEYEHLYEFLTEMPAGTGKSDDRGKWKEFAGKKHGKGATEDPNEAARARARLGNLVARKLDAFQNETQFAWADWNQRIAVVLSAALIMFVAHKELIGMKDSIFGPGKDDIYQFLGWLLVLPLGLAGGAVAPFAKDMVSSLAGFAKKK